MKLENDKIVIECRSEINLMQDMIENYLKVKKSEFDSFGKKDLETIKNKLDVLYMCW